jgi:hypothetical protein
VLVDQGKCYTRGPLIQVAVPWNTVLKDGLSLEHVSSVSTNLDFEEYQLYFIKCTNTCAGVTFLCTETVLEMLDLTFNTMLCSYTLVISEPVWRWQSDSGENIIEQGPKPVFWGAAIPNSGSNCNRFRKHKGIWRHHQRTDTKYCKYFCYNL